MAKKRYQSTIINNNKWTNAHFDRMSMAVPKGEGEIIKAHAAAMGESLNAFLTRAARETMERDKANEQR